MSVKRESSGPWNTNVRDFLGFQRSVLDRVSDYFDRVGDLAATASVEPGPWIRDYAEFWSGLVEDVGAWTLRSVPPVRSARRSLPSEKIAGEALMRDEWVAVFRAQAREGERVAIRIDVPAEAFTDWDHPDAKRTLFTDGLKSLRGKKVLPFPGHVRLVSEAGAGRRAAASRSDEDEVVVTRLRRRVELKVFDVRGLAQAGETYVGLVWCKETKRAVAAVELEII